MVDANAQAAQQAAAQQVAAQQAVAAQQQQLQQQQQQLQQQVIAQAQAAQAAHDAQAQAQAQAAAQQQQQQNNGVQTMVPAASPQHMAQVAVVSSGTQCVSAAASMGPPQAQVDSIFITTTLLIFEKW